MEESIRLARKNVAHAILSLRAAYRLEYQLLRYAGLTTDVGATDPRTGAICSWPDWIDGQIEAELAEALMEEEE